MDQETIELRLYHIISGNCYVTYNGQEYHLEPNTPQDRYIASLMYQKHLDEIKYEDFPSWDALQKISKIKGLWTDKDERDLDNLNKMLEDAKYQLFLNHYLVDKVKLYKKQISNLKSGIQHSMNNKYAFYTITKENYASTIKRQTLLALSIRDNDDNKVFTKDNFLESNGELIGLFTAKIFQNSVTSEQIREIARSEPWRSMWAGNKGNTFGTPSSHWSEEQRHLVAYSRMYDNVQESLEPPPENVINDDDMLDGWFIKQKKDREKEKQEKKGDELFKGKGQDGQELFMVAGSRQEAGNIYDLNDNQSRNVIKNREKEINEKGRVNHQDLSDVKLDMRLQATREAREHMLRK